MRRVGAGAFVVRMLVGTVAIVCGFVLAGLVAGVLYAAACDPGVVSEFTARGNFTKPKKNQCNVDVPLRAFIDEVSTRVGLLAGSNIWTNRNDFSAAQVVLPTAAPCNPLLCDDPTEYSTVCVDTTDPANPASYLCGSSGWVLSSGSSMFFNVRTYGAVGDGSTDDTAAIQAASTAAAGAGIVYLPCGTYKITAPLELDYSNAHWMGEGGCTDIQQATTATDGLINGTAGYLGGIILQDLGFSCTTAATPCGVGINFTSVGDSVLRSVQVIAQSPSDGFLKAMLIYSASGAEATRNQLYDVRLRTAVSASAIGLELTGSSSVFGAHSTRMYGGSVRADLGIGIKLDTMVNQCVIDGVTLEGNTATAISVLGDGSGSSGHLIIGNRFENNSITENDPVMLQAGSVGNLVIGNVYASGATRTVVDDGTRNIIIEPTSRGGIIPGDAVHTGSRIQMSRGIVQLFGPNSFFRCEAASCFDARVHGNAYPNWFASSNGTVGWGSGGAPADITMTRAGTGYLQVTSGLFAMNNAGRIGSSGNTAGLYTGTGSPEGVQAALPGSYWANASGGSNTAVYVKASGSGNTGWVPVLNTASTPIQTDVLLSSQSEGTGATTWLISGHAKNQLYGLNSRSDVTFTGNTGTVAIPGPSSVFAGEDGTSSGAIVVTTAATDTAILTATVSPRNTTCSGAGNPDACCTGSAVGTCNLPTYYYSLTSGWYVSAQFNGTTRVYPQTITVEGQYEDGAGATTWRTLATTTTNTDTFWRSAAAAPSIASPYKFYALRWKFENWSGTGTTYLISVGLHHKAESAFPAYLRRDGDGPNDIEPMLAPIQWGRYLGAISHLTGPPDQPLKIAAGTGKFTSLAGSVAGGNNVVDVRNESAKCDLQTKSNGSISSGNATLTVATATFTSADVGKSIRVSNAGTAGGPLDTTIASFTSNTVVVLTATASTTTSTATVNWWTDDTSAINTTFTNHASTKDTILIPPGLTCMIGTSGATTGLVLTTGNRLQVQGTLKAAYGVSQSFDITSMTGSVSDIHIWGTGVLDGNDAGRVGGTDEQGHNINITDGPNNIEIGPGLTIYDADGDGVGITQTTRATGGGAPYNITIHDNFIWDCGRHGVRNDGSKISVVHNMIYNNENGGVRLEPPANTLGGPYTDNLVSGNIFWGNSNCVILTGKEEDYIVRAIISDNICYLDPLDGGTAFTIADGVDSIIANNIAYKGGRCRDYCNKIAGLNCTGDYCCSFATSTACGGAGTCATTCGGVGATDPNLLCVDAGNPEACCTGVESGSCTSCCSNSTSSPCSADADCAALSNAGCSGQTDNLCFKDSDCTSGYKCGYSDNGIQMYFEEGCEYQGGHVHDGASCDANADCTPADTCSVGSGAAAAALCSGVKKPAPCCTGVGTGPTCAHTCSGDTTFPCVTDANCHGTCRTLRSDRNTIRDNTLVGFETGINLKDKPENTLVADNYISFAGGEGIAISGNDSSATVAAYAANGNTITNNVIRNPGQDTDPSAAATIKAGIMLRGVSDAFVSGNKVLVDYEPQLCDATSASNKGKTCETDADCGGTANSCDGVWDIRGIRLDAQGSGAGQQNNDQVVVENNAITYSAAYTAVTPAGQFAIRFQDTTNLSMEGNHSNASTLYEESGTVNDNSFKITPFHTCTRSNLLTAGQLNEAAASTACYCADCAPDLACGPGGGALAIRVGPILEGALPVWTCVPHLLSLARREWTIQVNDEIGQAPQWQAVGIDAGVNREKAQSRASNNDASGFYLSLGTGATTDNDALWESTRYTLTQRRQSPVFTAVVYPESGTTQRIWVALTSANPMAATSGSMTGISISGFRQDTAVDTTLWHCVTNDGSSATGTDTATTHTFNDDQRVVLQIALDTDANGDGEVLFFIDGERVCHHTALIPGASTNLGFVVGTRTLSAGNRTFDISKIHLSHN